MTTVKSNRTKVRCMRRATAKLPIVVATRPEATSGIITKLGPHDVLLGRGAPHAYYEGNVKFRTVVATFQADYVSRVMHCHKQAVAQRVLAQVQATGGRFVEAVLLVLPSLHGSGGVAAPTTTATTQKAWRIASHAVALEKVKQALRTKGPVSTAPAPVMGVSETKQQTGGGGGHLLLDPAEQSATVPVATPVAATTVQGAAGTSNSSNCTLPEEEHESARLCATFIEQDLVPTNRDSKKDSPPPQPPVVANGPAMTVRKAAVAHATAMTTATFAVGPVARASIDRYALAVWQARREQEQLAAAHARQQTEQQQLRLHLLLRQRLQGRSLWQQVQEQQQQLVSPYGLALPSNRPLVLSQLLALQRTASSRGSSSNYY